MSTRAQVLALVQPAHQPPELMVETARAAEAAGIDEVWLWEDCFFSSGIAPAAAILSATERMRVGIGLLPVPLRAPTLTAMEIASIARMFPGRFLPGLGHGILDWMGQAGVRVDSPLTLLREHTSAITALLRGEEVTASGRYVSLDRVRLDFPPQDVPPVYIGGRGPKTLALGGELAHGLILDDVAPEGRADPDRVREVIDHVGEQSELVAFLATPDDVTPDRLAHEAGTLFAAGVSRVAAFAGGVNGPPASGEDVRRFIEILAAAGRSVSERLGP